ncbi:MAG: cysteine--tRNA ligase [Ruminococcaceae bacterium]|nr:cysteine--tRNA ligase [Oscillospiraceae bacterium]
MQLFNSMTGRKETLEAVDNTVRIYACGPTVYNFFHIGNGRAFTVYDVLRRYLQYKGYNVQFVQNFTDVDDKIINKANEEGTDFTSVSQKYMNEYFTDADGLNIQRATVHPLATENIQQIIDIVATLVEKGHAYVLDNDVYFRVRSFKDYGQLLGQSIDDLSSGARISVDDRKEDALDFALWKGAKEGEPYWESPWGKGRPGWHIECSAMAKRYLGDTIDIHCGGSDLRFPHHTNEIAQSECANGCKFSKMWFHVGFVNVNNEKMSKSKNNFFTVRDLAAVYGYEPLRYFAISAHYRSPINYEPDLILQAKASLDRLYNCVDNLDFLASSASETALTESENEVLAKFDVFRARFEENMDDDLNTANALSVLFEFVREINSTVADVKYSKEFYEKLKSLFMVLASALGLLYNQGKSALEEEIEKLIEERQQARKNKNFARADEIRDELKARGIVLEDTKDGVKWKMV